jgi:hypothetical protein
MKQFVTSSFTMKKAVIRSRMLRNILTHMFVRRGGSYAF